jgi:hypothetical protein
MGNVNRGLIALLVATVAFFALWLVALKPSSSSGGSGTANPGLGQFQSDINAAKGVQGEVDKASTAAAGETTATGASATASTPSAGGTTATASVKQRAAGRGHVAARAVKIPSLGGPAARLGAVERALTAHKVVALLFYNPAAPDDEAVRGELQTISSHGGAVVKLAIPLAELPSYTAVISQVPVNFSPTLVIVDRARQASEIAGFADAFEIAQRIDDALASRASAGS